MLGLVFADLGVERLDFGLVFGEPRDRGANRVRTRGAVRLFVSVVAAVQMLARPAPGIRDVVVIPPPASCHKVSPLLEPRKTTPGRDRRGSPRPTRPIRDSAASGM